MPSREASAFEEWDAEEPGRPDAVAAPEMAVGTYASGAGALDIAAFEWGSAFDLGRDDSGSSTSGVAPPGRIDREAAASALEELALRVRVGEIVPLGFSPGRSPAAALAATLTALLTRD